MPHYQAIISTNDDPILLIPHQAKERDFITENEIDQSHTSRSAPEQYPIKHHIGTEIWTGTLWDLSDRSVEMWCWYVCTIHNNYYLFFSHICKTHCLSNMNPFILKYQVSYMWWFICKNIFILVLCVQRETFDFFTPLQCFCFIMFKIVRHFISPIFFQTIAFQSINMSLD